MNILGIMSGNSCDGLDCCDVDVNINSDYQLKYKINKFSTLLYTDSEKLFLHSLRENEKYKMKKHETELTKIYLKKINEFSNLKKFNYISCHGQTVHHIDRVISIQLFDHEFFFNGCNIPVIYNFRENDIKNSGNGAPLMPFLDWLLFSDTRKHIVTLNIGGVSNISYIPKNKQKNKVLGFDTGPGMCLIDMACRLFFNARYDVDALYSSRGKVNTNFLNQLLDLSCIKKTPPKSMDIMDFGDNIIDDIIKSNPRVSNYDIIRTFVEFSIESIDYNISNFIKLNKYDFELICSGGGIEHPLIKEGLIERGYKISSISSYGVDPSIKEALLIAILGACKVMNINSNMPSVTGAKKNVVLGEIYNG